MNPVWIFRHIGCEGPGYLATVLARFGIPFRVIAIDEDQPVPRRLEGAAGLVFMGGPMSVHDPLAWIGQELDLIRQAASAEMPVLGHCLGGQLISLALGGNVTRNAVREIGWHAVKRLDSPLANEWLGGLPHEFEVFHWHGETFSIPEGATPLLSSEFCANQAFGRHNILALQCHVEMTAPMVREWAALYADELTQPSASVQDADSMVADVERRAAALQEVAETLYSRWVHALTGS